MVLIFSSRHDHSTSEVMNWLDTFGEVTLRINMEDFINPDNAISFELRDGKIIAPAIPIDSVSAVWYRKTTIPPFPKDNEFAAYLDQEVEAYFKGFSLHFNDKKQLGLPKFYFSKMEVLQMASALNWKTPVSLVTSKKDDLEQFASNHQVISKPLAVTPQKRNGENVHLLYAELMGNKQIAALPKGFLPTLFQEYIEKKFELRICYIDGQSTAVAIFSQANKQTSVDFRKYDFTDRNKKILYQLPDLIQNKIKELMQKLNLNFGVLDVIVTPSNDYVFLEVNPYGQFGMISKPTGIPLEKSIAQFLSSKS